MYEAQDIQQSQKVLTNTKRVIDITLVVCVSVLLYFITTQ